LLDANEKLDRLGTVNDAVIVSERHVHHRPDYHLSIHRNGTLLDGVQPEDADLRRIEDGGAEQ
jgi:hypothetical protein